MNQASNLKPKKIRCFFILTIALLISLPYLFSDFSIFSEGKEKSLPIKAEMTEDNIEQDSVITR